MYVRYGYLQDCLSLFPKMSCVLYGKKYDMDGLGAKLSDVAKKDSLSLENLMLIRDAEEWEYSKFWPDPEAMLKLRKPIEGCFRLGWEGRGAAIKKLYDRFQHIEVVSIILRFVDPNNFGIISPPVEKFLGLQPQENHVKYYLTYLNSLKVISSHYERLKKLAEVDMALWCLWHLLKNWRNRKFREKWDKEDQNKLSGILAQYKMDTFLRKQKLNLALYEVYEQVKENRHEPNRLLLAECLDDKEIDPEIAMVIASYTFECLVWRLIRTAKLENKLEEKTLLNMINKLEDEGFLENTSDAFHRCRKLRNFSIHPWISNLNCDERIEFVKKVNSLVGVRV